MATDVARPRLRAVACRSDRAPSPPGNVISAVDQGSVEQLMGSLLGPSRRALGAPL